MLVWSQEDICYGLCVSRALKSLFYCWHLTQGDTFPSRTCSGNLGGVNPTLQPSHIKISIYHDQALFGQDFILQVVYLILKLIATLTECNIATEKSYSPTLNSNKVLSASMALDSQHSWFYDPDGSLAKHNGNSWLWYCLHISSRSASFSTASR